MEVGLCNKTCLYMHFLQTKYINNPIPNCFMTLEICAKTIQEDPRTLVVIPDHLKTQEMYAVAVRKRAWSLLYVPNHLKTQNIYNKAVQENP